MAAAAFFFSLMSLLVKLVGQRLPSQEIVLGRGAVTLVLAWIALRRAGVDPRGNRRGLLVLRGVLGFAALSCFYYAVVHLPLADVTVLQYTNPVFTALIAAIVLSETLGAIEAFCVATSLTGVVLIARPSFLFGGAPELDPLAVGVALAGAVLSAGAYVTVRSLGATEHPLVIVFWFAAISTLGAIPTSAPSLLLPTPAEWAGLLGVGITTHIAQVYMTRGLKEERAGRAMSIAYLQIVFAAVWGALFFGEIPDAWTAAGATLVVAGTFVLGRERGDRPAP